jgi:hypothetical protein
MRRLDVFTWYGVPTLGSLAVIALLSLLLMTGCSDSEDNLMTPQVDAVNQALRHPVTDLSFDPAMVVEGEPEDVWEGPATEALLVYHYEADGWAEEDDILMLNISPDISLFVPRDAVDDDEVHIYADVWVAKEGTEYAWVQFDFNPSMRFDRPVELRVKKDMAQVFMNNGDYVIWYYNEWRDEWQIEDIGQVQGEFVLFHLDHFSKWALAE